MSGPPDELREFGAETRPREGAIDRVRSRVAATEDPAARSRALLQDLPGPSEAATARVLDRLQGAPQEPRRRTGLRIALVAAAVLLAWLGLRALPPSELDVDLSRTSSPEGVPGLALQASGAGSLTGNALEPVVNWQVGSLELDVAPGAGLSVRVETDEAQVRVLGTAFTVRRDALGTSVDVRRGRVEVTCRTDGAAHVLPADASIVCLPTTPAGLLARGRTLRDQGAAGGRVLEALELGLQLLESDTQPAVEVELRLSRAVELVRDGQDAAALAAYRELKEMGPAHRRDEVHGGMRALLRRMLGSEPPPEQAERLRAELKALEGSPD